MLYYSKGMIFIIIVHFYSDFVIETRLESVQLKSSAWNHWRDNNGQLTHAEYLTYIITKNYKLK